MSWGPWKKKNNIARVCSVHQKMVRIGNSFWSLFQTFACFIAELFCHQLVLPWLKHGFKKDKSLPWTNIKTINHTAHAYVWVRVCFCVLWGIMAACGNLWCVCDCHRWVMTHDRVWRGLKHNIVWAKLAQKLQWWLDVWLDVCSCRHQNPVVFMNAKL